VSKLRMKVAWWLAPELVRDSDRLAKFEAELAADFWWFSHETAPVAEVYARLMTSLDILPAGGRIAPDYSDISSFRERLRRRALEAEAST